MKYSFYSSVRSQKCVQKSFAEIMELCREGGVVSELCNRINSTTDEVERANLKNQLPVVCWNRLFGEGMPRKKNTGEPTGVIMADFDFHGDNAVMLAETFATKVSQKYLTVPELRDHIKGLHLSARKVGFHVLYTWFEGCHSLAENHAKLENLLDLGIEVDKAVKDNSRCSFLVPSSYWKITADLDNNEESSKLQKLNENESGTKTGIAHVSADNGNNVEHNNQAEHSDHEIDMRYDERIVNIGCRAFDLCQKEANLREVDVPGFRHTNLLSILSIGLYRIVPTTGNLIEVCRRKMPSYFADEEDNAIALISEFKDKYGAEVRPLSMSLRRIYAESIGKKKTEEVNIEEQNEKVVEEEQTASWLPTPPPTKMLPFPFDTIASPFEGEERAGIILASLPMLGTLCTKIRAKYPYDDRDHAPNFQMVVCATAAAGKGRFNGLAKYLMKPFDDANTRSAITINNYNEMVNRMKNTKELPEEPQVVYRAIPGKFTEAGFAKTQGYAHDCHMFLNCEEADEVKSCWKELSPVLRKAFDNAAWGRTLQSTLNYMGERKVYFNTILSGTPSAVARLFPDPEDGLVHRTIFWRKTSGNTNKTPKFYTRKQVDLLESVATKLHDAYALNSELMPQEEVWFDMREYFAELKKWLFEKYDQSIQEGNEALETFRRRDAVISYHAAMICEAIYKVTNRKITKEERKKINGMCLWIAEYCLAMHMHDFGEDLNRIINKALKDKKFKHDDFLNKLGDQFFLIEAYKSCTDVAEGTIRQRLARLCDAGYLVQDKRGHYIKVKRKIKK